MFKKLLFSLFTIALFISSNLSAQVVADSVLQGDITSGVTLSANKIYMLRGFVVVKSPATLSIEAG
ncbi:MAG: T9SS C-terminal target domain-containing protein, partial [Bacteroidota bacterium]